MSLSKANIGLMEGEEVIFEKQTKIGEEKEIGYGLCKNCQPGYRASRRQRKH